MRFIFLFYKNRPIIKLYIFYFVLDDATAVKCIYLGAFKQFFPGVQICVEGPAVMANSLETCMNWMGVGKDFETKGDQIVKEMERVQETIRRLSSSQIKLLSSEIGYITNSQC